MFPNILCLLQYLGVKELDLMYCMTDLLHLRLGAVPGLAGGSKGMINIQGLGESPKAWEWFMCDAASIR
jgi:hypothetical protein